MKSKLLMAAGLLAGSMAFAGSIGEMAETGRGVAVVRQGDVFQLIYKAETQNTVTVSIFDANDQLVLSERIRKIEGFSRPYNFIGMKKGVYTIVIKDENGVRKEKIDYNSEKSEKLINLVKISGEEKYLFTAGGKGSELITLNIYDALDNLIHKESKRIAGEFGQVYNLEKIRGAVRFEVVHEDGAVEQLKN
jgi:hypothetical protein